MINGLNNNYALYRLPYADAINVVAQTSGEVQQLLNFTDLEKHHGFAMIPFNITIEHPILIIRPDILLSVSKEQLMEDSESFSADIPQGNRDEYEKSFSCFHNAVEANYPKLVLSRHVEGVYSGNPITAFIRACEAYPRAMVYLFHTENEGTWIGSTPEILLCGSHSHFRTVALAGTMPFTENAKWSDKNTEEQAIVAEYIRKTITPLSSVVEEEGPYTSRAGHLIHLKSEFHFSPKTDISIIDFIRLLHPTPAVCGLPKEKAYDFIIRNEGYDRRYYSGIVGMLDAQGDTNLYVNLRCAHLTDGKATLYAGGGILPESDMESEWKETEAKLQTICTALR